MELFSVTKALLSLLAIAAVLLLCLYLTKRYQEKLIPLLPKSMREPARRIQIEAVKHMDARHRIYIINADHTRYTLLVGPGHSTLLDKQEVQE